MIRLNQISFLQRKLLAQVYGSPGKLLSFIIISKIAIGLSQFGISQRELGVRVYGSLKTFGGFEMISLARQLHPFVVVVQRLHRIRRRTERFRAQLLEHVRGEG